MFDLLNSLGKETPRLNDINAILTYVLAAFGLYLGAWMRGQAQGRMAKATATSDSLATLVQLFPVIVAELVKLRAENARLQQQVSVSDTSMWEGRVQSAEFQAGIKACLDENERLRFELEKTRDDLAQARQKIAQAGLGGNTYPESEGQS